MTALLTSACDVGKRDDQQTTGPLITILSINVGPDRPMPADGVIQIAFDRYLLPSTATRQSFILTDGNDQPLTEALLPSVLYDPVARTITLTRQVAGQPWLTEGQFYKLRFPIAPGDDDVGGFRAIDRATLDPNQPREIGFLVGPPTGQVLEPTVDFCADVLPTFHASCNGSICHGAADTAASSLVLATATGVASTAVGRIAQGANTSSTSTRADALGRIFGVNMPLVDPGNPSNSWLLYKVEMAPHPVAPTPNTTICVQPEASSAPVPSPPYVPLTQGRFIADDQEREILQNYVLGREMPYPSFPSAGRPLTFDEREKIRLWIAQGARVPENGCGGCGIPAVEEDAGAADAAQATDGGDGGDASPADASDQ